MSGLAAVLTGDRVPGVYRWRSEVPVGEVRRACADAGWHLGVVDSAAHPGKGGLLREIGPALAFPAYYGENFDALADCLGDLASPTLLLWDGWAGLAGADPQSYVIAVDVLDARTSGPPPFVVLLRGEGPEIDPPWLDG